MPYLENNESILDSSSASRSFAFSICFVSFLVFSFWIFNLSVSASISSVPLKAEINHERRCTQTECQEALVEDGEGEDLDGGSMGVAIKS